MSLFFNGFHGVSNGFHLFSIDFIGFPMDFICFPMGFMGFPMDSLVFHESHWFPMVFICFPMGFSGFPMDFIGFAMDLFGFPMDFIGFPMDIIGFPMALMCFPMDSTGFPIDFIGPVHAMAFSQRKCMVAWMVWAGGSPRQLFRGGEVVYEVTPPRKLYFCGGGRCIDTCPPLKSCRGDAPAIDTSAAWHFE